MSVYYVPVMICVATTPPKEAPASTSFLQKRKQAGRRTSLAHGHSQQAAGPGFEPRQVLSALIFVTTPCVRMPSRCL